MKSILFILSIFVVPFTVYSQSYKFRIYNEQDGLENRYINTINQLENGKLVLGTGEGLFTFDGFDFESFHTTDALAEELVESSFVHNGVLWLGHGNGMVTSFENNTCKSHDFSQYLRSKIVEIQKDKKDQLWFASQVSGMVRAEANGQLTHFKKGLEDYTVFCFLIDKNNTFWIGTDLGIVRAELDKNNTFKSELVGDLPFSAIVDLVPYKDNFLAATEDEGIFHCEIKNKNFTSTAVLFKDQPINQYQIKSIRLDQANSLWVSTNQSGLVSFSSPSNFMNYSSIQLFNESGTQASKNVRLSFHDVEGNLWIGTIGNGLYKLEESYFASYFSSSDQSSSFAFLAEGDTLWSAGKGILQVSKDHPGNIIQTFDSKTLLPNDDLTAIYKDNNQNVWVGTSAMGCFVLNKKENKFKRISLTKEFENCSITAISGDDTYIYVATNYGIFYLKNQKVFYHATIETGLSGNVIKSLFKDSRNRIWIGTTTQNIPYIENGEIKYFEPQYSSFQLTIKSFAEDNKQNIWAGTDGNGVICLTCAELEVFSKKEGLNSDYCYGLSILGNEIWVEHRAALSKIDLSTKHIQVYQPETTKSLSFNDNAIVTASSDHIYFGTSAGLLRYDKSKDVKNTFEPILSLDKITISDLTFQNINDIQLEYGDYKIDVSFRGISLNNPKGVTYRYLLEGYDTEWSDFTESNFAKYIHLPPGQYTFKVKAFNSDGIGGNKLASFNLSIAKPFWSEWWFYAFVIIFIILGIKAIVSRRERIFKENQIKLEQALDERTKEVVSQKEMLEAKNKDITDSIVYAKNIQNAMLPPRDILHTHFSNSFIYFKPRDIVSGDFFWVGKFKTKTIVACADCTGHGVPGAFMSLIGASILKDILNLPHIDSPEKVLNHLDFELHKLLNKNMTDDSIRDGMDISVVEYDESTHILKISSANRPVFLNIGGEFMECRGDRKSIGDSPSTENNNFKVQEYKIAKGDRFYLFSDGMTDQFGGPKNKKIKRSGLFKLLKENRSASMEVQRERLVEFINDWKGTNEQLDDMILIACEI